MRKKIILWEVDICLVGSIFMTTLVSSRTLKRFHTANESAELCVLSYITEDLNYAPTEISEVRIQPA